MSKRDVDAYLEKLSPETRATLEKVRERIRAVVPAAEERLSYGMPAFVLERPIAGYSAHANHCSYHPMSGGVVGALAADLAGYDTSKGTIRFPIGKPLPAGLIRKLVKARLAEIEAAKAKKESASKAKPKAASDALRAVKRSPAASRRARRGPSRRSA